MRTLKKTLCLVLALVLCFGLVGTAFAADIDSYTDSSKVGAAYKEAATVMMGLNIINGMSATEIGAEGNLTREQAAKIVAYMVLGGDVADRLSADKAPFDDVAATKWSAGYISYCVTAGIITGYGDGNFGPADELTGYQFAAMILRALGFGKNGEYEGSGWSINVAKDAFQIGLFEGDAAAAVNEPIQRQQAMLMAFNGLFYGEKVTTTATKYMVLAGSGSHKPTAVVGNTYDSYAAAIAAATAANGSALVGDDYTIAPVTVTTETTKDSLAADVYNVVKQSSQADAYGRPANKYIQNLGKTNQKTVATCASAPVATYTTTVTADMLYNTLGYNAKIVEAKSSATDTGTNPKYYVNTNGTIAHSSGDYVVANKNVNIGGNGIITEIYNVDDPATTTVVEYAVVQIRPYAAKLGAPTKVDATPTSGAYTYFTVGGVQLKEYTTVVNATNDKTNYTTDRALAKDDYILFYGNATAGYTVKHATEVSGKLTGYNSATQQYSVEGTPYGLSASFNGASLNAVSGASYTTPSNFIVDSYGYLVGTYTPASVANYLYVVSQNGYTVTTLNGTKLETVINAKVASTDGVISEVTVATVGGATATTSNVVSGLYTYTVDATTGKYALTAVTQATGSSLAYNNPQIVSGIYGNASTKYIIMTWTAGTANDYDRRTGAGTTMDPYVYYKLGTPTIVTGYANIGSLTNVVGSYIDAVAPSGIAEVVYIYTNGTAGATANYIYYLGTYSYDGRTYTYDVIKDGVKTTMTSAEITTGITAGTTTAGLMTLNAGTAAPVGTTSIAFARNKALYCATGTTYTLENKGGLLYAKASANDGGLTTTEAFLATIGDAVPVYTVTAATGAVTVGTAADLSTAVSAGTIAICANAAGTAIGAIWIVK